MEHLIAYLNALTGQPLVLRLWQSGRELFHSNVLAYLLESPTYRDPLLHYLWGDPCTGYHVRALREHNSIDLLVVMLPVAPDAALTPESPQYWDWLTQNLTHQRRARLLAIESKFKSLPDESQLQGYSERLHAETRPIARKPGWYLNCVSAGDENLTDALGIDNHPYLAADSKKVILTPTTDGDITVPVRINWSVETGHQNRVRVPEYIHDDVWSSKSWQALAELLLAQPVPNNGLESSFVASYAALLQTATQLQHGIAVHCAGEGSFAVLDKLRAPAEPLRLRDFVEKWRYQFLTKYLREALIGQGWPMDQRVRNKRGSEVQFSVPVLGDGAVSIVAPFFSRSTGGVDVGIFRPGHQRFAVSVQLQGAQLKLMFAMGNGEEHNQRLAVVAALQALAHVSPAFSAIFGADHLPAQLGRYNQRVALTCAPSNRHLGEVERVESDGRLLYASARMWAYEPDAEPGREHWTHLSTVTSARRMAKVAAEIATHWDTMANAMPPLL